MVTTYRIKRHHLNSEIILDLNHGFNLNKIAKKKKQHLNISFFNIIQLYNC